MGNPDTVSAEALRAILVSQVPYAERAASRIARVVPPGQTCEDLAQDGLVHALRYLGRYDGRHGTEPVAYVRKLIKWGVRQSLEGAYHTSNGGVRQARQARRARTWLVARGRPADAAAVAAFIGTTADRLRQVEASMQLPLELDEARAGTTGSEDAAIRSLDARRVRSAVPRLLDGHERHVVSERSRGRGWNEIGADIGLSRTRARRVHMAAIQRLRAAVGLPAAA